MKTKFPYECIVKKTGKKFIPIIIDYDNKQVLWQHGQTSDGGEWLDFTEVLFSKIESFIDLSENKHQNH